MALAHHWGLVYWPHWQVGKLMAWISVDFWVKQWISMWMAWISMPCVPHCTTQLPGNGFYMFLHSTYIYIYIKMVTGWCQWHWELLCYPQGFDFDSVDGDLWVAYVGPLGRGHMPGIISWLGGWNIAARTGHLVNFSGLLGGSEWNQKSWKPHFMASKQQENGDGQLGLNGAINIQLNPWLGFWLSKPQNGLLKPSFNTLF